MLLKDKKSMGYLWAEYFDEVCSDEIKIELYEFLAPPVIRCFGLYHMEIDPFRDKKIETKERDLVKGKSARVLYQEKGAVVEFGGIYSFNTVMFNGKGIWHYRLEAFDGSNYYEVYRGIRPEERQVIRLKNRVEGAYQIRLITEIPGNESLNLSVYDL